MKLILKTMKQKRLNWIKQSVFYGMIGLLLAVSSCKEKDNTIETYQVKIKLVYPNNYQPKEGVAVKLENTATNIIFEEPTDQNGVAQFEVVAGRYNVSASESRSEELRAIIFNGILANLVVSDSPAAEIELPLSESETNQLVIKELYNGGCQKDDGSGAFQNDSYVILYNNSSEPALLENVCLGIAMPFNATGSNYDYIDGKLYYDAEGWIPAGQGMWTFQQAVSLDPGKQLVIALKNAVDNTQTYSQSINFSNPEYYCTYDIAVYPNTSVYPAPSPAIPTNHYLKAYFYGTGNAWTISTTSPAFFIFATEGTTPETFANDASLSDLYRGLAGQVRKKVPVGWVLDAIEVFQYGNASNQKRLPPTIDAGYIELYNAQGFTLYRNVDKDATEAIPENAGKIVYNYSLGTQNIKIGDAVISGSTDPSGIDAEASIKNGARVVYKDTNNSSNDFHQRIKASLRN